MGVVTRYMHIAYMAKLYLSYDEFESSAREFVAVSSKLGDGWEERRVHSPSNPGRETVFLVKKLSLLINDCSDLEDQRENDHTTLEPLENGEGLHIEDDPAIIGSSENTSQHLNLSDSGNLVSSQIAIASVAELSPSPPLLSAHLEYHIVHSFSYEVPVLYFTATYSNGRQLSLNDTWKLLSHRFVSDDMDRWGLISQQEHPLLHCPFYHIHPCHTAKVMAQARKTQTGSGEVKVHIRTEGEGGKREGKDLLNGVVECSDGDGRTSVVEEGGKLNESCSKGEPNYLVTWLSTFGPLVGLNIPLEYTMVNN